MLPDPLHPAVVHFPIVLTFLLPIAVAIGLFRIRRGMAVGRAWSLAVVTAGALAMSSWIATETGEGEEEAVEDAVASGPLESHEEAAERFLLLTGGVFLLAGGGLLPGRVGTAARLTATAGALGLVVAGTLVGHSGGELVYRHGAAAAYSAGAEGLAGRAAVEQHDSESDRD